MNRTQLLTAAGKAIQDRGDTYGSATDNFNTVAVMQGAYLAGLNRPLAAGDVAALQVIFKLGRVKANPKHLDSWVDIAGYAALGTEVVSND